MITSHTKENENLEVTTVTLCCVACLFELLQQILVHILIVGYKQPGNRDGGNKQKE